MFRAPQDKESEAYQTYDLLRFTLILALIVIPLRIFVIQPFFVKGDSMLPAFQDKNYLIIDQISYRFKDPQRGDVVVFRPPNDPSRFYIKRIIAEPGERIVINGHVPKIFNEELPEGFMLDESQYINEHMENRIDVTLSEGEYFVMGDNRRNSSDSRAWGALQGDDIRGRVWLRLYPFKKISGLPGDARKILGRQMTQEGATARLTDEE